MRTTIVALVAVAVLASGCGDDVRSFSSTGEIADAIGCTDLETGTAEFVKETGACTLDGERVMLFVFEDTEQRDRWLTFGERFSKDLIAGATWAVDPPDGAAADLREALS